MYFSCIDVNCDSIFWNSIWMSFDIFLLSYSYHEGWRSKDWKSKIEGCLAKQKRENPLNIYYLPWNCRTLWVLFSSVSLVLIPGCPLLHYRYQKIKPDDSSSYVLHLQPHLANLDIFKTNKWFPNPNIHGQIFSWTHLS